MAEPEQPDQPETDGGDADPELERALSGLHRMSAPQTFTKAVEETLHRRSAGKFFRNAFADRVPLGLLAALALAVALAVYLMLRSSDTGSVETPFEDTLEAPPPEAKDAIPKPQRRLRSSQ